MSLTKKTLMVEVEEQTWKCEFCEFHLVSRSGHFGRGMTRCHVCKKDVCTKQAEWFAEDASSDYPDAQVCPACATRFREAWEWAQAHAGRYESLMDVVDGRLALRT